MRHLSALAFMVVLISASVARAEEDSGTITESDGLTCPIPNLLATPQQVIAARIAALVAGNINGVICTYAVGATVIMTGTIVKGRPAILASFTQFFALLGNTVPTFTAETYSGPMALVNYTVNIPTLTVPDGSDTYVIVLGRIQYQTVSATLEFTS